MLSLAAAVTAATASGSAVVQPIYWEDLGLSPVALDLGFFTLKWYSLAYLAGILLGYWHLSRMIKAPGAPLAQRLDHFRDVPVAQQDPRQIGQAVPAQGKAADREHLRPQAQIAPLHRSIGNGGKQ